MKRFCLLLALAVLLAACKKQELPHVPSIPSVVFGTAAYEEQDGTLCLAEKQTQGASVLAYLNIDTKESDSVAEIRRNVAVADGKTVDVIHVFSPEDEADYWIQADFLVLGASPIVLLEDKPFCESHTDNPNQFAETKTIIPAHTIVAAHHIGALLDYLQVSWLTDGHVQSGFIENPHPFFSTNADDATAIRLYQDVLALPDEEKEQKKAVLDSALALEGLSLSVRTRIQNARKALDPPPKPTGAYMRLRAPDLSGVRTGSRYGVNMGELLKGGTEDPWAKNGR